MTEQTNAELIADVRSIDADWVLDNSPEDSVETIRELAAALEAAEQRAAVPAAVVEKVRSVIERENGWFRYRAEQVSTDLATAPADALREHDTALIEKLADEWHADNTGTSPRAYNWLREKARQRREEQS